MYWRRVEERRQISSNYDRWLSTFVLAIFSVYIFLWSKQKKGIRGKKTTAAAQMVCDSFWMYVRCVHDTTTASSLKILMSGEQKFIYRALCYVQRGTIHDSMYRFGLLVEVRHHDNQKNNKFVYFRMKFSIFEGWGTIFSKFLNFL